MVPRPKRTKKQHKLSTRELTELRLSHLEQIHGELDDLQTELRRELDATKKLFRTLLRK